MIKHNIYLENKIAIVLGAKLDKGFEKLDRDNSICSINCLRENVFEDLEKYFELISNGKIYDSFRRKYIELRDLNECK